jgi:cyclophilin family peptidyl-prolyl cis-trans isomerase
MYHDKGDGNGASTAFFWLKQDRAGTNINDIHNQKVIQRLNTRYSLFGYVVEGNDILEQLREDDILVEAQVQPGAWKLVEPILSDEERVIIPTA